MFEGSFWSRKSNCRDREHFAQICKDFHANGCSVGHVQLKSGDHEVEMNSTMLRTKLLNEKSSNIYKITKHFHSGSVSVPRGKSLQRWNTGQAPYQVLHCTGSSPPQRTTAPWVKGCPRNMWQGKIKGTESSQSWSPILLGALLLLDLPHLAQQAHCAGCTLPWLHTMLGTCCAAPNSPACRQGEFAPLPF